MQMVTCSGVTKSYTYHYRKVIYIYGLWIHFALLLPKYTQNELLFSQIPNSELSVTPFWNFGSHKKMSNMETLKLLKLLEPRQQESSKYIHLKISI